MVEIRTNRDMRIPKGIRHWSEEEKETALALMRARADREVLARQMWKEVVPAVADIMERYQTEDSKREVRRVLSSPHMMPAVESELGRRSGNISPKAQP